VKTRTERSEHRRGSWGRSLQIVCAVLAALAVPAHADEVDRVLAKFDHEPTIREVQKAAIKYYKVDPDTINSLRSRSRLKALVPGLTVGFTNSISSFNNDIDDIIFRERGIAIQERQTGDFIGISASAAWRLDRLVFNVEELDVLSLIGIQDGIQREVTALYYVRRRLQIQLLLKPPAALEGRISARLRLEELTGLLDAYTGGFFSRRIGKKGASLDKSGGGGLVAMPGSFRNSTVMLPSL
jgi:hypothetical protein